LGLPHYTRTRREGRAAELTAADGFRTGASKASYAPCARLDSTFCACWLPTTHLPDSVQLEENHHTCLFSKPLAATKIISNRQTLFSNSYAKNQTFDSILHFSLDFYQ
jgi:hypothetical protein